MEFSSHPVFQWLANYAYQPELVYAGVFVMMIASGFGFPLPEEVTIVSVGVITYMGAHPELFPPPYEGAPGVNGYEAALATLCAVVFADMLVFYLGRKFGRKIINHPRLSRLFPVSAMERINNWVNKYGIFAAFIFRFTPGIRFPAHVVLGMSRFKAWHFALVDGIAAIISVPTQIILIYHYGEEILGTIHYFRNWILVVAAATVVYFVVKRFVFKPRLAKSESLSRSADN